MNDPIYKAQSRIGSSKTASKGSSSAGRKARRKKKRSAAASSQNAGQPTGPSPGSSAASSEYSSRSKNKANNSSSSSRSVPRGDVERQRSSRSRSRVGDNDDVGGGSSSSSTPLGTKIASYTVGALHGIDIGLGVALIAYGAMISTVTSAMAVCITYGLILALGAVAGTIGYYSGACNRRGLRASSIAGFITCLIDIVAFIAILASWNSFIAFLNDNHEALMLTQDSVKTIEGLKILFAIIFIFLAGLEVHRGLVMWSMKDTMSSSDQYGARVSPLTRASSDSSKPTCCTPSWFLSILGLSKRKKTDDFVMFDDNASMESSLLWSKNGAQATSDDYLEFVPEHERGLASFTSNIALPIPQPDRVDY